MVARLTALGNYDPSLYFHAARRRPECGVNGKHVGGGYEPGGHSAFVDGGGSPRAAASHAPVDGKSDYSRPAPDHNTNR